MAEETYARMCHIGKIAPHLTRKICLPKTAAIEPYQPPEGILKTRTTSSIDGIVLAILVVLAVPLVLIVLLACALFNAASPY